MKLTKVEITNFRCFESLGLTLDPDVNVLVGANGAGKSAALDGIAAVLYPVVLANGGGGVKRERDRQSVSLSNADIRIDPGAEDPVRGRKDFVHFRASATDYYQVDGFPSRTASGEKQHLEWSEYVQYVPPNGFQYQGAGSKHLEHVQRYFHSLWQAIRRSETAALISLPVIAYYLSHRHIGSIPPLGNVFAADFSREQAFSNALNASANFQSMYQWLYLRENEELRRRALDADSASEFRDLAAVRNALAKVIERLESVYFEGSPPRLRVRVAGNGNRPTVLDLAQLSDGYRSLIALVLDFARRLAQAHPNWSEPLDAPGILLVDELELHLHPRWQQTVVPCLRTAFPNTQLIVSTHSPSIVQTVRAHQLWILESDHSAKRVPDDFDPYGAEHSPILTEVFGVSLRPLSEECRHRLRAYQLLIDSGEASTGQAATLRHLLEGALGTQHPEMKRCDVQIRQVGRETESK